MSYCQTSGGHATHHVPDIVGRLSRKRYKNIQKEPERERELQRDAISNTSVTILQAEAAEANQNAASDAPTALSVMFDAGAARALQSEGRAKVTALSELLTLLDSFSQATTAPTLETRTD